MLCYIYVSYDSLERLICYECNDIEYVSIWFILVDIGNDDHHKENPIFHFYFLNKDILVTKMENIMKFLGGFLHVPSEGSVSQILRS